MRHSRTCGLYPSEQRLVSAAQWLHPCLGQSHLSVLACSDVFDCLRTAKVGATCRSCATRSSVLQGATSAGLQEAASDIGRCEPKQLRRPLPAGWWGRCGATNSGSDASSPPAPCRHDNQKCTAYEVDSCLSHNASQNTGSMLTASTKQGMQIVARWELEAVHLRIRERRVGNECAGNWKPKGLRRNSAR